MIAKSRKVLRRRALQLQQNATHPLYVFSLTGEELLAIADISRIARDDAGKLIGYQRPDVKRHIQDIVAYLDEPDILFPNSIILALSSRVRFRRSRGPEVDDGVAAAGIIELPLPKNGQSKPAWIVDGQQRALALSKCRRKGFPIPVNAFIADEIGVQRDQFLRVNNTKPLPRGLITELLPEVSAPLPAHLSARKIPSAVCDWLNEDASSPFCGLIRRSSTPRAARAETVVSDASVVNMVEESLSSPSGCLFPYRNIATGETDFEGICSILVTYWHAVKRVFAAAWGKPPTKSRLMHGAGIRSMGRLMDRIMPSVNLKGPAAVQRVERELRTIASLCRWTSGQWEQLDNVRWNEIQNVPRHIRVLSNVLIRAYVQTRELAG